MILQNQDSVKIGENPGVSRPAPVDIFNLFGIVPFPYSSKVSFAPLIRYWEGKTNSPDKVERLIAREIQVLRKKKKDPLDQPLEDISILKEWKDLIQLLVSLYVPLYDNEALVRITGPFNTLPFYHSAALEKLLNSHILQPNLNIDASKVYDQIVYRAGCMILNRFYGQKLKLEFPYVFTVQEEATGLAQHFSTTIDTSFMEVIPLQPVRELNEEQIHQLLSNVEDIKLWLNYLPPESFEFRGIFCTFIHNASATETLSRLKDKLLQPDALLSAEKIQLLEKELCTYFGQPDLKLGIRSIGSDKLGSLNKKYQINHGLTKEKSSHLLRSKYKNSIYQKVLESKSPLVIDDLRQCSPLTDLENKLLDKGIRNLVLVPLVNKARQVIGLFELGSPRSYHLTNLALLKVEGILSLFCVAIERSQAELDNQIQAIVRKRFTSIHPSVEWAFMQKAYQLLQEKEGPQLIDEDHFVFRDNYPLYGQADIVGSSVTRNSAIQADLIENLYEIEKILLLCDRYFNYPLAGQVRLEVRAYINRLKGGVNSNSEYDTMQFIRTEVHPLLRYLKKKSPELKESYEQYVNQLDPELGTIYKRRKDYENSVALINRALSDYLDEQEEQAQQMCPHYFEKFQTDGVAYNIYAGQSLLQKGKFTGFHLKNLRLWQLIGMCEITRKMAALQKELPTPLTTAQLIFVHSSPLSIRFRLDEKRFDVDGAYNARYEILKKRIDKAVIENSNERLTVAGKIAIVYQHRNDRQEYMRYLKYLQKRGYLEKEIEDLSLKKMQGVQGLKALRVTVKPHSG